MSIQQSLDLQYAYFLITGPSPHEHISMVLGLMPSQAWNPGDRSCHSGRIMNDMCWRIDSGLDHQKPIDQHVHALLNLLMTREQALKKLWPIHNLTIRCVGKCPTGNHGVFLERSHIFRAARLGIAFDFDFYHEHPTHEFEVL